MLLVSVFAASALAQDLNILQFSDVHEIYAIDDGENGGFPKAKTVIDEVRATSKTSPLILQSGDFLAPSVMSAFFQGEQVVDLMNHIGVNYGVLGNHEFDFGPEVAAEKLAESTATWLMANLVTADSGEPLANALPSVIVDWEGTKVGIMGLVNDWRDITSAGESTYLDYVPVAREIMQEFDAAGVEVVIALTHAFVADDRRLAEEVPGIHLILGGHDHTMVSELVNGTVIIKSGSDLRHLANIQVFKLYNAAPMIYYDYIALDKDVVEDPETLAIVDQYEAVLDETLGQVIGETLVAFDTNRTEVRRIETPIGNLIADAQREIVNADVALTNGGNIRGDRIFETGAVTGRDVLTILPFNNIVVKIELTGQQLLDALENSVSQAEHNAGRFAQVSGMTFTVDVARNPGSRISDVLVNGEPLDLNRTYTASVNDYIVEGGDGYDSFVGTTKLIDELAGPYLAEVVTNYIAANSPVAPEVEGRITFK
jgi:5'-nucleotidase